MTLDPHRLNIVFQEGLVVSNDGQGFRIVWLSSGIGAISLVASDIRDGCFAVAYPSICTLRKRSPQSHAEEQTKET